MILKQSFHNLKNKKMASQVPYIYYNPAVTNTLILVNAGFTTLVGWNVANHSTGAYLKCFNAASTGDVTLGTTSHDWLIPCPTGPAGLFYQSNEDKFQINFNLGLVIAVVSNLTVAASSAPAQACSVSISYDKTSQ